MILTGMFHLKLLIHPELLISNGSLFHNDEPLYEALFKPRSNFLKDWQGRHPLILGWCKILQIKIYYKKMHQVKCILLQIILTEAASKWGYHGTGMGSQTKWTTVLIYHIFSIFLVTWLIKTFSKSFTRFAFV